MKYVNILLIGLVLLFPGCTFLDVVPEGNIESIESNFEKRDQTENWFKYCHFWVSPFTTSVISNPAYMGMSAYWWQAVRKSATLMALRLSFCSLMMALSMGIPWLSQPGI